MEKGVIGDPPRSNSVVNVTVEGEQLRTAESDGSKGGPNVHVFNEQTNYVPRSTIITVSPQNPSFYRRVLTS